MISTLNCNLCILMTKYLFKDQNVLPDALGGCCVGGISKADEVISSKGDETFAEKSNGFSLVLLIISIDSQQLLSQILLFKNNFDTILNYPPCTFYI